MSRKTQPKNDPGVDPGIESVTQYLQYTISLPERAIRSTAALVGGIAHQSASLLVPGAFQDSKTYQTFVKQMLDMVVHDIGGTKREAAPLDPAADKANQEAQVESYVAKKTVSTFVDLAGMATLHVSPLTILAVVSDVAYGSNVYLKELAAELKREGVIDSDSTIDHAADLLDALGAASGKAADTFDRPPLSLAGLKETIEEAQASVGELDPSKVIPQAELKRMWTEMEDMASEQGVDLIDISSAMTMYTLNQVATVSKGALTTIRVTGELLDKHLFEHYWDGLHRIHEQGIWQTFAASSQPWIEAVWLNFSADRETITEDVVSGRLLSRTWRGFCDWLGG